MAEMRQQDVDAVAKDAGRIEFLNEFSSELKYSAMYKNKFVRMN